MKGLEKGTEPYLEMQEEYSLWFERLAGNIILRVQVSTELHEVEELGGLERGRSPLPWLQEVEEYRGAGENSPL